MNPGEVILIRLPTFAGGPTKLRPALVVALLPGPYQTILLCGISSQVANRVANWDELLDVKDKDFKASGVHQPSIIRLSYLYAADPAEIAGQLGSIDPQRFTLLQTRLADQIKP